jgi:hypothetical protein
MRWMSRIVVASAVIGSSLVSAQPTNPPKPVPVKPTKPVMPEYKPPVGAVVMPCLVRAELESVVVGANNVAMKVVLKNIGSTAATVSLGSNCGARFTVSGEPASTCPPSPCRPAPIKTVTIAAKSSLPLGTLKVSGKGNTCRAPMPDGSTMFQAVVVTDPPQRQVCSGAVLHVIKDPKTHKLRKAALTDPEIHPAPAPQPAPPKPAPIKVKPKPKKPCPACGIGCPNGAPSSKVDANGCSVCACEDLREGLVAP